MAPHSNSLVDAPLRIWLVDDDSRFSEMLSLILNDVPDIICDAAFEDCESALRRLSQNADGGLPGLVLMDVNLPGMNGLSCTAQIHARLPEVPILMLTIRDDADTIYAALRAGASGYLVKESPIDQIVAAIREARSGGMLMPGPVARKMLSFFAQASSSDYGLSIREMQVLEKMVEGLSQKEIASALFVSLSTVNTHIQNIYAKLHVHSSSAAVAKALKERII